MNQMLGLLLDSLGILQNIDQVQPSLSKVVIIYSRIDNFLKQIFFSFRVLFSPNFQNNHELGREPKRHYFDLTLTTICHNFAMTGAQSSLLEMHLELISKTYKMAVVSVFIFFSILLTLIILNPLKPAYKSQPSFNNVQRFFPSF